MARFQVRTRTLVTNAKDVTHLQRLVEEGKLGPKGRVREMPDGEWFDAEEHPALADITWRRGSAAFPHTSTSVGNPITSLLDKKGGKKNPFADSESTVISKPPSVAQPEREESTNVGLAPQRFAESYDEIEELDADMLVEEEEEDEDASPLLGRPEPDSGEQRPAGGFARGDTSVGNPIHMMAGEKKKKASGSVDDLAAELDEKRRAEEADSPFASGDTNVGNPVTIFSDEIAAEVAREETPDEPPAQPKPTPASPPEATAAAPDPAPDAATAAATSRARDGILIALAALVLILGVASLQQCSTISELESRVDALEDR